MALLSRLSHRGSVRRNPDTQSGNNGRPPPLKKQRTLEEYGLRRRRSSPDCLDTTTTQDMTPVGKPRSANPPLKAARPRTSTRRARRSSSSSIDSIASETQLKTPTLHNVNGNGSARNPRLPGRNTPSVVQRLRGDRESPDPLDTISPAPPATTTRPRSRASVDAPVFETKTPKTPAASATRSARQNDPEPKTEPVDEVEEKNTQPEVDHSSATSPPVATRSQQKRKSDIAEPEQSAVAAPAPVPSPAPAPAPQAPPAQAGTERRSLRSADTGTRCKSELAQYFYNYEQIISLENPKPVESLAANTSVLLVDDLFEPLPFASTPNPTPFGNPLDKLYDCEEISLPTVAVHSPEEDPLGEEFYSKAHRRFERQEKQLRNIERDRAQHEKQQLERLLEELRGPEWLRVMGLPGVHENEKKPYEPKRDILIAELVALVNKFQAWKDEERRRKIAKEKGATPVDTEAESRRARKRSRPVEETTEAESSLSPGIDIATPSTPDPSDVDAWAALQLHQEARSADDSVAKSRKPSSSRKPKAKGTEEEEKTKTADKKGSQKRPKTQHDPEPEPEPEPEPSPSPKPDPEPVPFYLPPPPPPDNKPFTSFFSDPHEREKALAAKPENREERTHPVLAFGQPIPEVEEREFAPPEDYLTPEAIQSSRRQRRLLKRRSNG